MVVVSTSCNIENGVPEWVAQAILTMGHSAFLEDTSGFPPNFQGVLCSFPLEETYETPVFNNGRID